MTFSTVNPRFLQEDLLSQKKSVYMKNAEGRAWFEIFWQKSWKCSLPCQNQEKPSQNDANYLLCGFLRNWPVMTSGNLVGSRRFVFEGMVLEGYFELESMLQNLNRRTHFLSLRLVFMRAHTILVSKFCDSKMYFFARFCNSPWHAPLKRITCSTGLVSWFCHVWVTNADCRQNSCVIEDNRSNSPSGKR